MSKLSSYIWKRLRSERGVAALEFAIVCQLLLLLLYGMVMYGFVFLVDHSITQAAAEGARYALSEPSGTSDAQIASDAASYAQNHIPFSEAKTYGVASGSVDWCDSSHTVKCVTVTITYDNRAHPVIPGFIGMQYLTPGSISASSTVELGS